jgi:hypothetical protein
VTSERRAEVVDVRLADGRIGVLRCPNFAGALLLKARAIQSVSRDQDREDLSDLFSVEQLRRSRAAYALLTTS